MSSPDFNASDSDWVEFAISASLTLVVSVVLGGAVRTLSRIVQRLDTLHQLVQKRCANNGHVLLGEYNAFSLLGVPHVLRTRSALGFAAHILVVVTLTALALVGAAFSGSRKLRVASPTVKVTALPGEPLSDEDAIAKFADWFRSSGVVSMCQRRAGGSRTYYQPFVELGSETQVYCGKPLPVRITHEKKETIEAVSPTTLTIDELKGVTTSTPSSRFVSHDFNVQGTGMLAVCNTGEYYRTIRSGRVAQRCAFTTKTRLILGGYHSNATAMSGPGETPVREDIVYYDSYSVDLQTELSKLMLMQTLVLWDLGTMSEVEVAVLARMTLAKVPDVPSFVGGFERLQIDVPLLASGVSVALVCTMVMFVVIAWHQFVMSPAEKFFVDLADLNALSRIVQGDIVGSTTSVYDGSEPYTLAFRDVTKCSCPLNACHTLDCQVAPDAREFRLGPSRVGRPTHPTDRVADIIKKVREIQGL